LTAIISQTEKFYSLHSAAKAVTPMSKYKHKQKQEESKHKVTNSMK